MHLLPNHAEKHNTCIYNLSEMGGGVLEGIGAVANIQGILLNRFRCPIQLPALAETGTKGLLALKFRAIFCAAQAYAEKSVNACGGRLKGEMPLGFLERRYPEHYSKSALQHLPTVNAYALTSQVKSNFEALMGSVPVPP